MARKYGKPIKQRALVIKLENKINPIFGVEYFALVGGKWVYMGSKSLGIAFSLAETLRSNFPLLFTKAELEYSAGRKINFKRESFIHEWTSHNLSRDSSF